MAYIGRVARNRDESDRQELAGQQPPSAVIRGVHTGVTWNGVYVEEVRD